MNQPLHVNEYAKTIPGRCKRWVIRIAVGLVVLLFLTVSVLAGLRWVDPPVTAFMLQESWTELDVDRHNLREWWVGREELPDHLKWAAVAGEDQRFHIHRGFDFEAIREAIEEQRRGDRVRGASTISQQVAKNLFLWPSQSYFRKSVEAGLTVLMEWLWPKDRILEVYLNIAEFGPGLYGVGRAADAWYGLHPSDLEPFQSARLVAVLPSPRRMRVEPPSPYTRQRSDWILRQMNQLSGRSFYPAAGADQTDDPGAEEEPAAAERPEESDLPRPADLDRVSEGDRDSLIWDEVPDSLLVLPE